MEGEADPEQAGALAGLYLDARRPERALRVIEAQLKRGASGVLHVQEAEALARVGRVKQAKDLLRKELGGSSAPLAATELARLLQREGAYAEASATLRQALRRQPDNDALVLALSSALHLEGKAEASVQVLQEIVTRRPGERGLLFGLGAAQERAGQWRQAIDTMRQILRRNPKDAPASNFIGYTLVEHGEDLKAAERFIRQALFVSPGEGFIVDSLGWLYYRQGRFAEAKRLLEMAVRLAPREPEVLAHLAEIEAARRDLNGALRLLRQAVAVSEDVQLTAKLKKRLHELEKGRVGALR